MNLWDSLGRRIPYAGCLFLTIFNKNDELGLKLSTKFGKNDIMRLLYLIVQWCDGG